MTTTDRPDDRADVIERAESAIVYAGMRVDWEWDDMPHQVARSLSDAGLLASPADQDAYQRGFEAAWADAQRDIDAIRDREQENAAEGAASARRQMLEASLHAEVLRERAERAEAKVRAVQELADQAECDDKDVHWRYIDVVAERDQLAEAVRKIHERRTDGDDEWCVEESADWPCATIRALDTPAGEQP